MRRLKRDPLERAFLRGYQYGINGKSRELCPFTLPSVRQAWLNGWREGRGDNWDGLIRITPDFTMPTPSGRRAQAQGLLREPYSFKRLICAARQSHPLPRESAPAPCR